MAPSSPSIRKTALWLCAATIVLAWLPRMQWGFWTDEAGTYWMAAKGWRESIPRTAGWAGQSILYSVIESLFATSGPWAEPLMRVPSLIAMSIAAWQLKFIAQILMGAEAGWIAVVLFLCAPDASNFGTSARPYALALAAALASFRYLLEWRAGGRGSTIAKYLVASVLTIHLHYLFGFVFVIQGLYLGYCMLRGERLRWNLPIAALIAVPLSLLPLLPLMRSAASSRDFSHAAQPEWINLLWSALPPVFLLGIALGGMLLFASGRSAKWRGVPLQGDIVFLIAMWLTLAPILFFGVSYLTPRAVFSARYLLFVLPASVLAATWAISGFQRPAARSLVTVAIFAAGVLHPGIVMQNWRPSTMSWREPLEWIAAQKESPAVFITSGVANTETLAWQREEPHTSQYFSPLLAYPIQNVAHPLPYQFNEGVQKYIRESHLGGERYLLLATGDSPLVDWMKKYMGEAGFRSNVHDFNDYVVVDFQASRGEPHAKLK